MSNFQNPVFNDNNSQSNNQTFQNVTNVINQHNQNLANPKNNEIDINFGNILMGAMQQDAPLLDLTIIQDNKEFVGAVWCKAVKYIPNKFDRSRVDGVYTFIDKNGIMFTSRIFSIASINETNLEDFSNSPVYIEGIAYTPNENMIYRVDKIVSFTNTNLSIDCFIQCIPQLEEEINQFKNNISQFENAHPSYLTLINKIDNLINIVDKFKGSSYKPFIGNKLGAKILIYNSIVKSVYSKLSLNQDITANYGKIKFYTLIYLLKIYFEYESGNQNEIDNIFTIINMAITEGLPQEDSYEITKILTDSSKKTELMRIIESEIYTIDLLLK